MTMHRPTFNKRGRRTGKYRSRFEAKVALGLRGLPFVHEGERIPYAVAKHYIPDFRIGNVRIEAKGFFDAADRAKHLALKAQHPDLDIRFVFQNASTKLNPRSKTTYGDWATKHGFKWASGSVPDEWRKDFS